MRTSVLGNVVDNLRRSLISRNEIGISDAELLTRFIAARDEAAFEAIMRRHGPMVLGVSKRILRNSADAEDAFQATFLVLIRKASSIRPRQMVGNWLYGVACTTALKAKAMSSKRIVKERSAAAMPKPQAPQETCERLHSVLDEELKSLPDLYRAAIVLCDLEGKSIKEAAQVFDCPMGTIGPRLVRGRRMLAKRLARRGIYAPAGILMAALTRQAALAELPPPILNNAVKILAPIVAGRQLIHEAVSAKVAALSEGVLRSMLLSKIKVAVTALMMFAIVALGIVLSQEPKASGQKSLRRATPDLSPVGEHEYTSAPVDGGVEELEPEVVKALEWIAKQQQKDGFWEFDGTSKDDKVAATGLSLLPFLAGGDLNQKKPHRNVVDKGIRWLVKQQNPSGQFGDKTMYSTAIATLAICEAYAQLRDAKLKQPAQNAVNFIVKAQSNDGSWGYKVQQRGDTSILGWQMMAIRSAKAAGLNVPKDCLAKAGKFLDSVASQDGSQFAYMPNPSAPTPNMTASGLNSRLLTGVRPAKEVLDKGLESLWKMRKPADQFIDVYYFFFATQSFYRAGEDRWEKDWNPAMRKLLLAKQKSGDNAKVREAGSWPSDGSFIGQCCGTLGTTCISTLILEVPLEHLNLFKKKLEDGKKRK